MQPEWVRDLVLVPGIRAVLNLVDAVHTKAHDEEVVTTHEALRFLLPWPTFRVRSGRVCEPPHSFPLKFFLIQPGFAPPAEWPCEWKNQTFFASARHDDAVDVRH